VRDPKVFGTGIKRDDGAGNSTNQVAGRKCDQGVETIADEASGRAQL
jgi:hypothetical protein